MEYTVIKGFKDRYTKEHHEVGGVYVTDDAARADFLINGGYIEGAAAAAPSSVPAEPEVKEVVKRGNAGGRKKGTKD